MFHGRTQTEFYDLQTIREGTSWMPPQQRKGVYVVFNEPVSEQEGGKEQGPNIAQIWAVREWFINIAGMALLCGILIL
jgi:hypothetical protein